MENTPAQMPDFEQEQAHLSTTYQKLKAIKAEQESKIENLNADAAADKDAMTDDLTIDLADFDARLETMASIEALNRIVDIYTMSHGIISERLEKARVLLEHPYFAKVVLRLNPNAEPREIYLGTVGMSDDSGRLFIVDWRSDIAETYYNQSLGHTSYTAHGRTIEVDLLLRRQFDLLRDKLYGYFDTSIAIEDPLLLQALSRTHSAQMKAITATIQKEQNQVIRHPDVPVLLVRGIAGSGKTSVLLQRIAYLFYQHRQDLDPDQVYLISPNPVFSLYISQVLPDMGERNPHTPTWVDIARDLAFSPTERGAQADCLDRLNLIDEVCEGARLLPDDCRSLRLDEEVIISSGEIARVIKRFARIEDSKRAVARVNEELHDLLEARIARDGATEFIEGEILDMDLEEQCRRFGGPLDPTDEEQLREAGREYVAELYKPIEEAIDKALWISVRRLEKRLIGNRLAALDEGSTTASLRPLERAYLKLTFSGVGKDRARFVMIDEVQDYSAPQLKLMARYFPKAHILLLGDPNQAIYSGTASYEEIKNVMAASKGPVSECALLTSYRCTPEITKLFMTLADDRDKASVASVQRDGAVPKLRCFENEVSFITALKEELAAISDAPGISAMICADDKSLEKICALLGQDAPAQVGQGQSLPKQGLVALPLHLAKGLEFDRVIIPDADGQTYRETEISRHRLYTAASRATAELSIFALGKLTPLLTEYVAENEN